MNASPRSENRPLLPLILDDVPDVLRSILAQEGVPTRDRSEERSDGRFVLFDSRRGPCKSLAGGQVSIDVDALREAGQADPFVQLADQGDASMQWSIDRFRFAERIARVDKRAVRQAVLHPLRKALEAAGGVWIRVAPFPFPHRTALNFRIDYDEYDRVDFNATLDAIAGYEDATSHFVNGAAYEAFPEALTRMRDLDVGSHGYWHHTYRTYDDNRQNVRRGIETLERVGIEPSGFVAPLGRFNRSLAAATESLGISHGSEFGLAYDERPFFPNGSEVLQLPVHPVCLGLFLEAGQDDRHGDEAARATLDHFLRIARWAHASGEPIFLYGHPTRRLGRYPDMLRRTLDLVSHFEGVWKTTLTEFARWWRHRDRMRLTVSRQGEELVANVKGCSPLCRGSIEYCRDGATAVLPLDNCLNRRDDGQRLVFSPDALNYENQPIAPTDQPDRPTLIHQPRNLRSRVRDWIDWELVTPIDEISGSNWRNLTKRTLRRIRA